MAKVYSVIIDGKVVFGPKSDYNEIKNYVAALKPAEKAKCSVQVSTARDTGAAGPATATKEEKPAPTPKPEEQTPGEDTAKVALPASNADDIFTGSLEGSGVSDLWKPKNGRNLIRILPLGGVLPTDWQTPYPFIVMGVHPNVGLSLNETVCCPRLTYGKACPICNFAWNLYNSKNSEDKELSKRIRSYRRVLSNIIDLSEVEKGVQKFSFGKKLAEKVMSYKRDPEYIIDGRDFLDPEVGRNFVLIKKMVDNYPNYDDSRPEIKTTPLSSIYPNWRKHCHDLTKELDAKTYDEMMVILTDTKKAMLSTDPGDLGGHRPAATQQVDPDLGVPITDVSQDEVQQRLDNL